MQTQRAKKLGSLFVFWWFVFSSSSKVQTDHAVSCFSTLRTLEKGYLIPQLPPAALDNVGHELTFWAFTQDCHWIPPHWPFSVVWEHLACTSHLDEAQLQSVNPSKGKCRMMERSQGIEHMHNPSLSHHASPTTMVENKGFRSSPTQSTIQTGSKYIQIIDL